MPLDGFRLWLVIVALTALAVALILMAGTAGHLKWPFGQSANIDTEMLALVPALSAPQTAR
jgi:hypothetical protein